MLRTSHNLSQQISKNSISPKEVSRGVSDSFYSPQFLPTETHKLAYGEAQAQKKSALAWVKFTGVQSFFVYDVEYLDYF